MASIVLTIIQRIGYLDIEAISTRAVFPFTAKEAKNWVFDSRKKAHDVCWGEVGWASTKIYCWNDQKLAWEDGDFNY